MSSVPVYAPPRSHTGPDEEEELRIPVENGGFLHARGWWMPKPSTAVVILHGIAGSKDSFCCVRVAVALHRLGYHTIRLDMRAAGDSVIDAPSLYHGGLTTDLDATIRHVAKDPRVTNVLVLGYSGGGSIALKLAGEWGSDVPSGVSAIGTISAPLDYVHVVRRMDMLRALIYRRHVLGGLKDRARAFATRHPKRAHYAAKDVDRLKLFRDYDDAIIVPMHGFDSVDQYYRESSSGPYLPKVRVPSLVVHSEDDPMVSFDSIAPWQSGASEHVAFAISKHGGHIGWVGGVDEANWVTGWGNQRVIDFFEKHRSG